MDKRILTLAGVVLLLAGIIFFFKFCNKPKCSAPTISIDPGRTATTRQQVTFHYSSDDAKEDDQAHWIFGDSKEMDGPSPVRYFQKPGSYLIRLIVNGHEDCSATDSVIISEAPVEVVQTTPVINYTISCPDVIYIGVPCQFKAIGDGGKTFQWDFAETGKYEPKTSEKNYTYKYTSPGNYSIVLHVDDNISATKKVTVKIKNSPNPNPGKPISKVTKDCNFMKDLLNQFGYAAKRNDEDLVSDVRKQLVAKLCGNESVPVRISGRDDYKHAFDFYLQDIGMRFREVKEVTCSYEKDCITEITISE